MSELSIDLTFANARRRRQRINAAHAHAASVTITNELDTTLSHEVVPALHEELRIEKQVKTPRSRAEQHIKHTEVTIVDYRDED